MVLNTTMTTVDFEEVLKIADKVWKNIDLNHPISHFRSMPYLSEEINRLGVKYSSEYLNKNNIHFDELVPLKNAVEDVVLENVFAFLEIA